MTHPFSQSLTEEYLPLMDNIDSNTLFQTDATVTKTLIFGNLKSSNEVNFHILNASVDFILTSKRFDEPH